ncbi:MAG: hypothetical protein HQL26_10150 [Candidatus Omnitrophica bacterium]|nr:hypothetical protein [Candidatus Omnitrophota bacterium]
MNCPNKQKNLPGCTCTYTSCEKQGVCCECVRYHRAKGAIPGCFFPADAEKTYDRSVQNFVQAYQKK